VDHEIKKIMEYTKKNLHRDSPRRHRSKEKTALHPFLGANNYTNLSPLQGV
jgi:hypothetical protein